MRNRAERLQQSIDRSILLCEEIMATSDRMINRLEMAIKMLEK